MNIQRLSLTNYRGVQSMTIDFHKNLNVFFGENGAGKSAVLDAIAIMLSWAVNRIGSPGASGRPILETDITNGKSFSSIELFCSDGVQDIEWKLVKSRRGHGYKDGKSDLASLNEFTKLLQGKIFETKEKVNLTLFVYYPVNRAVLDIPLRIRGKHLFYLLAAYDEALTGGANFRTFFEWFREREDLENENRKYVRQMKLFDDAFSKPKDSQFPDPQLEAVRKALNQFLPEFKNLTVRRNPLRMEIEKNGKRLTVNQLSGGEKCMIAMIGDLARRIAIANPVSEKPLEGEGIILIDEIDLHLHPKWQRMMVPKLTKVFPNCQFVISTHSPHVITHVQPDNLYLLKMTDKGITAEKPSESYGKNVDRILEDLMGLESTRPDEVSSELSQVYEYIARDQFVKARQMIEDLKDKIGDDPELVKAEVLINRKKSIGK